MKTLSQFGRGARDLVGRWWAGETCIYCHSPRPVTRDHVLPECLGTYDQGWTLDCVCAGCNNYFSRLELALGRDSLEGFLRVDLGVRPPSASRNFLNRRMSARIISGTRYLGLRLEMRPGARAMTPVPVEAQVGFRAEGQDWVFLTARELTDARVAQFRDVPFEIQLLVHHGRPFDALLARLEALGIHFTVTRRTVDEAVIDETGQPFEVEHEFFADTELKRAALKIAFNYAAHELGAATVRRSEFNVAREFVRFGHESFRVSTVHPPDAFPALSGPGADTTRVHACGLAWVEGRGLVALVTLFNHFRYGLRLCNHLSRQYSQVNMGHIFDPHTRRIYRAGAPN